MVEKVNESALAESLLVKVTVDPAIVVPAVISWLLFSGSFNSPLVKETILKTVGVVPSGSEAVKLIIVGTFSVTVTALLIATGGSFTGVIEIVTVAFSLSEFPSYTLKTNESEVAESDEPKYITEFEEIVPSKIVFLSSSGSSKRPLEGVVTKI